MWRDQWPDLAARQIVITETGSLASGGFILADPFGTQLRLLSEEYLREAWERLDPVLAQYQLHPPDLSWGWLHPGITRPNLVGMYPLAPSDYVGWISQDLARFWEDSRYVAIDEQLQQYNHMPPMLRCASCYRSLKWRIAPEEYHLALRMIEAMATEETSNWSPPWILRDWAAPVELHGSGTANEPWLEMARAIQAQDQHHLDEAVRAAKSAYSPAGYRLVVHGFGSFISQLEFHLQLPDLPDSSISG